MTKHDDAAAHLSKDGLVAGYFFRWRIVGYRQGRMVQFDWAVPKITAAKRNQTAPLQTCEIDRSLRASKKAVRRQIGVWQICVGGKTRSRERLELGATTF